MTYEQAIKVTSHQQAELAFEALVSKCIKSGKSRAQCIVIQKQNLGYISGYYDIKTQKRVERLYKTVHPIFGSTKKLESRQPENVFRLGKNLGRKLKKP